MYKFRRFAVLLTLLLPRGISAEVTVSSPNSAPSTEPGYAVEIIRSVPYCQRDDKPLLADIYRPRDKKGPFPVIMMVHGGAWFLGDKVQVTLHARYAAQRGYAVVAINYRLAPRHKFPAQLEDCRSALRWLGQHADQYDFDRERIAAYGYSSGGHLVSLLAMTSSKADPIPAQKAVVLPQPPTLKAVVAGGAPCEFDWIPKDSHALAYWLGGSREELPEVYRQASPTVHVDPQDPPVFFFHGERDQVVPLSSPLRLKKLLEDAGITTAIHVVPGALHYRAFIAEESRREAIDFLDHVLNPQK